MKIKKSIYVLMIVSTLISFFSCSKGGIGVGIEVSSPEKSLMDLSTETYDESQLLEIAGFDGSIEELDEKYPIECLREKDGMYRVSYLGINSVAIILFDKSGDSCFGNVYNLNLVKSDFDGIEKGQSLNEVQEIDPNGEYLFLYTGRNDIPKISTHYTKDGYLINIEYDVSHIILNMNIELI